MTSQTKWETEILSICKTIGNGDVKVEKIKKLMDECFDEETMYNYEYMVANYLDNRYSREELIEMLGDRIPDELNDYGVALQVCHMEIYNDSVDLGFDKKWEVLLLDSQCVAFILENYILPKVCQCKRKLWKKYA